MLKPGYHMAPNDPAPGKASPPKIPAETQPTRVPHLHRTSSFWACPEDVHYILPRAFGALVASDLVLLVFAAACSRLVINGDKSGNNPSKTVPL
jgi:hypothetical protein